MPWIKLNDNAPDHPKVAGLTDRAFRVWIRSLCYAAQFQTDGILPTAFLATVSRRIYLELVDAGLWVSSHTTVAIHDYLKHQSSKDLVTQKKALAAERSARYRARHALVTPTEIEVEVQKDNPPLPARRAGTDERILNALEGVLRTLTTVECATASLFQDAFEAKCRDLGWRVQREVRVENRGDGRAGYVDLVVHEPFTIALELDRQAPRVKSIEKLVSLAGLGYTPVVVCRNAGDPGWSTTRGVHVWGKPKANKPAATLTRFASLGVRS